MDEPTWERNQILREWKLQICKHISICKSKRNFWRVLRDEPKQAKQEKATAEENPIAII